MRRRCWSANPPSTSLSTAAGSATPTEPWSTSQWWWERLTVSRVNEPKTQNCLLRGHVRAPSMTKFRECRELNFNTHFSLSAGSREIQVELIWQQILLSLGILIKWEENNKNNNNNKHWLEESCPHWQAQHSRSWDRRTTMSSRASYTM